MGIRLNVGQDGELLASTEKASIGHYQQILLAYLDSGVPIDVTTTNKLPVTMDLSALATASAQATGNTKLDSIISALSPLATEVTVATLGTEVTLATRATEVTLQAALDELVSVIYREGPNPSPANTVQRYVQIGASDSPIIDAFSRLRVSEPQTHFDSTQIYEADIQFSQQVSGGGTGVHNVNHVCVDMRTTNSGDAVYRQSLQHIAYQPGKSQLCFFTFAMGSGIIAGVTARVGLFDATNGLFLENDGATLKFIQRSETSGSPVDTGVPQASWNIDPMDGTGPSGKVIDISKVQILVIDYEWLGVGRVRMGFVIGGLIHYCHHFLTANIGSVVYMATPHLPARFEIVQSAANPGSLDHICSSVMSEGGRDIGGLLRSYSMPATVVIDDTKWWPIISIRPKLLYNTLQNKKSIVPTAVSIVDSAKSVLAIKLVFGGTLTGATFAIDPGTIYAAELDIASTAITGGIDIFSAHGGEKAEINLRTLVDRVHLSLDMTAGHPMTPLTDNFTIMARTVKLGTTGNVVSSITWGEEGT